MSSRSCTRPLYSFLKLLKNDKKKSGYTLLETSIVILVFTALVAGGLTMTNSVINHSKKELSDARLAEIYKAFGRFVAKNKRLPCPASLTYAKSDIGYAKESSGDCILRGDSGIYSSSDVQNVVYGMLPVNSLGLSDEFAEDGFGSKFSYIVNSHLTTRDDPSSFENYDLADTDVDYREGFGLYRNTPNKALNIAQLSSGNFINDVAFVVISHGGNKNGAFSSNSSAQNSIAINNDDYHNVPKQVSEGIGGAIGKASFGKIINGDLHIVASNLQGGDFDDSVVFKSRSDIVSDFDLAHLMPCIPEDSMQSNGFSIVYSGQVSTGDICASYSSARPQKTCGQLGGWLDKVSCPTSVASVPSEIQTVDNDNNLGLGNIDIDEVQVVGGSGDIIFASDDAFSINGMLLPNFP